MRLSHPPATCPQTKETARRREPLPQRGEHYKQCPPTPDPQHPTPPTAPRNPPENHQPGHSRWCAVACMCVTPPTKKAPILKAFSLSQKPQPIQSPPDLSPETFPRKHFPQKPSAGNLSSLVVAALCGFGLCAFQEPRTDSCRDESQSSATTPQHSSNPAPSPAPVSGRCWCGLWCSCLCGCVAIFFRHRLYHG